MGPTVGVFAAIFDDQRRVVCVKRAYGPRNWTIPGGAMEQGESPVEAIRREVEEETGYLVQITRFVGVYSAPFRNDLVLMFEAEAIGRSEWQPNDEIAQVESFRRDELPRPMTSRTLARIADAFDGRTGVVRGFEVDEPGR